MVILLQPSQQKASWLLFCALHVLLLVLLLLLLSVLLSVLVMLPLEGVTWEGVGLQARPRMAR